MSIITPQRRAKMTAATQADNRDKRRATVASGLIDRQDAEPLDPEDEADVGDASITPTRAAVLT